MNVGDRDFLNILESTLTGNIVNMAPVLAITVPRCPNEYRTLASVSEPCRTDL
jgi:hypothetical protein